MKQIKISFNKSEVKSIIKEAKQNIKPLIERSNKQRFVGLKNAFNTIDAFAVPSLSPSQFENYEKVKKQLLKIYGNTNRNI